MKQKTLLILLALLLTLACIFVGCTTPTQEGEKTITVEVVHADGTAKTFTYKTQELYFGAVLKAEGLVKGEQTEYGLYISEVDGEAASDEAKTYWALYDGDSLAATGADGVAVVDGGKYKLALESWG